MDPATIGLLVNVGILGASAVYHRLTREKPERPKPESTIRLPTTQEGSPVPIIYGTCRVDHPVLAWTSATPIAQPWLYDISGGTGGISGTSDDFLADVFFYQLDMFFVVGLPVARGNSTNRLVNIYAGSNRLLLHARSDVESLDELTGEGSYERDIRYAEVWNDADVARPPCQGEVEFLNGGLTQELVNSGVAVTRTGEKMIEFGVEEFSVPGFRGFLGVSLTGVPAAEKEQFFIGTTPDPPALAFEMSSHPLSFNALSGSPTIGTFEMNPADALIDLLRTKHGKVGLPEANVYRPSFIQAANTLHAEGHGFSRCFDAHTDVDTMLGEICKQADGVLYEDPSTGQISFTLIRGDFNPADTLSLDSALNCTIEEYDQIGTSSPVTSVRVNFRNRAKFYQQDSAIAPNMAAAVTTDEQNEVELDYPGICTHAQALAVAEREVAFLSRPLASARVRVNRDAVRVAPGNVVNLTDADLGISRKLFRVGHVTRGTLNKNDITLHLIEDIFYEHRGELVERRPTGLAEGLDDIEI